MACSSCYRSLITLTGVPYITRYETQAKLLLLISAQDYTEPKPPPIHSSSNQRLPDTTVQNLQNSHEKSP